MKEFLETGKIVNTHGLRGDVKVVPWSDSPEFLLQFKRIFIGDKEYKVEHSRVQKGSVLMKLAGIDDVDMAMHFREQVISIAREDAKLPEGRHFVQDLIGLKVHDLRGDRDIGTVRDVFNVPAGDIYEVQNGSAVYLIPANPVFVKNVDLEAGVITVSTIEGMADDE